VIIDEIKRLVAGGKEVIDVVDSLEEQQLRSKASGLTQLGHQRPQGGG
jgi:hypothetical protein